MSNTIQQFLQVSAKLYEHLKEVPQGEERNNYIDTIQQLLDSRSLLIDKLKAQNFEFDPLKKTHQILKELDEGINLRLKLVYDQVKLDIKNLQNAKRNETQYMNPYANVQVMDGTYYDKKK